MVSDAAGVEAFSGVVSEEVGAVSEAAGAAAGVVSEAAVPEVADAAAETAGMEGSSEKSFSACRRRSSVNWTRVASSAAA